MKPRKVLLVGWDAADWKVITPLMDAGKMPNVQRLVENGAMGQIATLQAQNADLAKKLHDAIAPTPALPAPAPAPDATPAPK